MIYNDTNNVERRICYRYEYCNKYGTTWEYILNQHQMTMAELKLLNNDHITEAEYNNGPYHLSYKYKISCNDKFIDGYNEKLDKNYPEFLLELCYAAGFVPGRESDCKEKMDGAISNGLYNEKEPFNDDIIKFFGLEETNAPSYRSGSTAFRLSEYNCYYKPIYWMLKDGNDFIDPYFKYNQYLGCYHTDHWVKKTK